MEQLLFYTVVPGLVNSPSDHQIYHGGNREAPVSVVYNTPAKVNSIPSISQNIKYTTETYPFSQKLASRMFVHDMTFPCRYINTNQIEN